MCTVAVVRELAEMRARQAPTTSPQVISRSLGEWAKVCAKVRHEVEMLAGRGY